MRPLRTRSSRARDHAGGLPSPEASFDRSGALHEGWIDPDRGARSDPRGPLGIRRRLLAAAASGRRDAVAFEGLGDPAGDLRAGAGEGLHLRLAHVSRLGRRAGGAPLVLHADLALDLGRLEGAPDHGGDESEAEEAAPTAVRAMSRDPSAGARPDRRGCALLPRAGGRLGLLFLCRGLPFRDGFADFAFFAPALAPGLLAPFASGLLAVAEARAASIRSPSSRPSPRLRPLLPRAP